MHVGNKTTDIVFLVAILATSVVLGAALAHAFELPHKIFLARDDYFTVQQIYAGWNRLAYVLLVEICSVAVVIGIYWQQKPVRRLGSLALASIIAVQIVFWVWTFPANQATSNWTEIPPNWEQLRAQWEYSHLAGAVLQRIAMVALVLALIRRHPRPTL